MGGVLPFYGVMSGSPKQEKGLERAFRILTQNHQLELKQ